MGAASPGREGSGTKGKVRGLQKGSSEDDSHPPPPIALLANVFSKGPAGAHLHISTTRATWSPWQRLHSALLGRKQPDHK